MVIILIADYTHSLRHQITQLNTTWNTHMPYATHKHVKDYSPIPNYPRTCLSTDVCDMSHNRSGGQGNGYSWILHIFTALSNHCSIIDCYHI